MKLETFIIGSKGAAFVAIGIATPLGVALAQWLNTETWPPAIVWVAAVIPACITGAANSWISFVSTSFGKYVEKQNGGASPTPPPETKT